MDAREQRGLVIAALCKLERNGSVWSVPSQSGDGKRYSVDPTLKTCTCPDHQEGGFCCKHIHAVSYVIQREVHSDGTVTETKSVTFTEQKKHVQDWPKYNMAQSTEKSRFLVLLADLCGGIEESPYSGRGRPPIAIRERLFSCILKIYSTVSSRRFASDLVEAKERDYVNQGMHYNQVNVFLQDADTTDAMQQLVVRTFLPLRTVETTFAVDSSGFSVSRHVRWMDEKYGIERSGRDWVKCHLIVGVKPYPVIALDTLNGEINLEDKVRGRTRKCDHADLSAFVRDFFDSTPKLKRPFIAHDRNDKYGRIPEHFEQQLARMMADDSGREFLTSDPTKEPEKNGPEKQPSNPKLPLGVDKSVKIDGGELTNL